MLTQRDMLERNVEYRGDNEALKIYETSEEWTYREFDEQVNQLANALLARGIREGDRVAISLYNTSEFPVSVFACYKIAAVPVPLNYMLTASDLRYIFDDINAEMVIYDADDADVIQEAAAGANRPPDLIEAGGMASDVLSFDEVFESGSKAAPPEIPRNPGRISYMLYTSGTTGRPKGVTFTQETAYHRIQEAYSAQGYITQRTTGLQLSPFFHGGGMGAMINPVLCNGGTIVLAEDWGPEMAPEAIDEHDVTYVVTVPTVLKRITDRDDIEEFDFSTLEVIETMGAPLSKKLATDVIEKVTPNIYNSYGSTETLYDLMLRPEDLPEHAGKTGRPNPDKQIRVIKFESGKEFDPDDRADVGEEGQIIAKGEGIMDYYFGNYEATEEAFEDNWFYSSDLGVKDEQGYITITGRADDMIVSGGELVSPSEVEENLESHTAVEVAVVVGVPDEEWGERVKAYVVAEGVTEEDLEIYCKGEESLADYKRPKEYEFVDNIERTATGKKQRFKYRTD